MIVWDIINECGLYRLKGHKDAITQALLLKKKNLLVTRSVRLIFFSFCSNLRSRVIACLFHGQNLEGKKKERELRKCFMHFHKHLKLLVLLPSFTPARRTAL